MKLCFLDLETENVSQERDPQRRLQALRIGWLCISFPESEGVRHFQRYRLGEAVDSLDGRTVVGWNLNGHDLPLLALHTQRALPIVASIDLFRLVKEASGLALGQDEVVRCTLGYSRDFPISVPAMFRRRAWDLIASRCEYDVRTLEKLFAFVQHYGYILNREGRVGLSVDGGVPAWTPPEPMPPTPRQINALRNLGRKIPATAHEAQRLLSNTRDFWTKAHAPAGDTSR